MKKVSIVIPTKDKSDFLKKCLESINSNTSGIDYELIIVDHASTEQATFQFFQDAQSKYGVTVVHADKEANFSKLCNVGAKEAQGEFLLFLNNDTQVTSGWLHEMIDCYKRYSFGQKVGCIGAKLLFPDGRIQHIGQMLRYNDHVPTHLYYQRSPLEFGVRDAVNQTRKVVGVTAACMLVKKKAFEEAKNFDEAYEFGVEDVDLCFKLKDLGYTHYYCHTALVYHQEHGTLLPNTERDGKNLNTFFKKWNNKMKRVEQP